MRRATAALALFPLAVMFGACGGDDSGDGDIAAFCDAAVDLEGSDVPDPDDVRAAVDAAPDEIRDDLEVVLDFVEQFDDDPEALTDLDPGDLEDLEDAVNRVGEFAEDECDIDLDGADDTTTTTAADDEETTTTTGGDADDDSGASGDPTEWPETENAEQEELAQRCFDGDGEACDELFFATESGSDIEDWADRCGGRYDESPGLCSTALD